MQLNIGMEIAKLRKGMRMTQEQLAVRVGVTAAAVSKWETGGAYPDITLLAPLARVLGVSVDELLSFKAELSKEETAELIGKIESEFEREGYAAGRAMCDERIREYPNCAKLKLKAAGLYLRHAPLIDGATDESVQEAMKEAVDLLEQTASCADAEDDLVARSMLASYYFQLGEYEKSIAMLDSLPKNIANSEQMYPLVYSRMGRVDEAERLHQLNLYSAFTNAKMSLMGLSTMAGDRGDFNRALEYAGALLALCGVFGLNDINSFSTCMSVYMRMGDKEKALEYFERFIDAALKINDGYSENPFFSRLDGDFKTIPGSVWDGMLKSVSMDGAYALIRDDKRFARAVERLRRGVEKQS